MRLAILLCLLAISVPIFAVEIETQNVYKPSDNADRFVGIVTAAMCDPNGGNWIQVYVVYYYVMVWYRIGVEMPTIGTKVWILAIYYDVFPYPTGRVSIYKGLSWEAVNGQTR